MKFPKTTFARREKNTEKVVEKFAPMPNDKKQSSNAVTVVERSHQICRTKKADVEEVRNLAYRFWQERGRPAGSSEEDWFRAERELASAAENRE